MKIIITESQCRIINEALGVPDNILNAAEELFNIVAQNIKSINYKSDDYNFEGDVDIELGYNKKIVMLAVQRYTTSPFLNANPGIILNSLFCYLSQL